MLYYSLKIFHIVTASVLLLSIAYSYQLWRQTKNYYDKTTLIHQIQNQTSFIIIPLAMMQLISGFTIISLRRYNVSDIWIIASSISFIIMIISWLGFLCCLFSEKKSSSRCLAQGMLIICAIALLTMIFFMANKITSS